MCIISFSIPNIRESKSSSRVQLLATPWTVARQPPLAMGFPKQEYRSVMQYFSCPFHFLIGEDSRLVGRERAWELSPHIRIGTTHHHSSPFGALLWKRVTIIACGVSQSWEWHWSLVLEEQRARRLEGPGVGGWECREGQSKASLKDLPDSPEAGSCQGNSEISILKLTSTNCPSLLALKGDYLSAFVIHLPPWVH